MQVLNGGMTITGRALRFTPPSLASAGDAGGTHGFVLSGGILMAGRSLIFNANLFSSSVRGFSPRFDVIEGFGTSEQFRGHMGG